MILLRALAYTILSPFILAWAAVILVMYIFFFLWELAAHGELLNPRRFMRSDWL